MIPTFEEGDRIIVSKRSVPKRYDIITLDPLKTKKESYIKRVIGLPCDPIRVDGNSLYLEIKKNDFLRVKLTDSVAKKLSDVEEIPRDKYFVLGDNRNHSNDSRSFGLVSIKQIEGVAFYRYYPLNRQGKIE